MSLIKITVQEGVTLNYIDDDTFKFLINGNSRMPAFYILPKGHKPGRLPSGRPIVSTYNSALEPISMYKKDTKDFILQLGGLDVAEGVVLMTTTIN